MIINVIVWVLFGALAGWLASIIMKTNGEQGGLANIIIGILGALLGGFISRSLGGPTVTGFNLTSVIVATIGGSIITLPTSVIQKRGSKTLI